MENLSAETLAARIRNEEEAIRAVRGCMRRYRVRDYIPGQVFYNLGDYPYPFRIEPTEYDARLLHECAAHGVGLVQLHEEWNDAQRFFGADKYTTHDPVGFARFLDLCHAENLKVIAYASTTYIDERDPDFRESFTDPDNRAMCELHYRYRKGSPRSPEWVRYILPKMRQILDTYDLDGLYNDMGYKHTEYTEALLSEVYSMVRSRGGIYKMHVGGTRGLPEDFSRCYDYLWIGEAVKESDGGAAARRLLPYVVPCPDYRYFSDNDPDYIFAQYLPFLQFPILTYGRPVKGLKVEQPRAVYTEEERFFYNKRVGEYHRTHPDGPFVYSEWSAIPDSPVLRERWFRYLALYRPMVTENTLCFLDIGENTVLRDPLPPDVHISLFVNEKTYLVLSNLGEKPFTAELYGVFEDRETAARAPRFEVAPHRMRLLEKIPASAS